MAKLSVLCILVVLLVFTCEEGTMVGVEAKECHQVWDCKGDNRCWQDCKNRYNGRGMCDLYTAPPVPKQCFCAYKC